MNITGIRIENIKGIKCHNFEISLLPNRPNILVAPNGFGKSSFAIAFESLHESRNILDEKNYHLNDSSLIPLIEITTSTGMRLIANNTMNNIRNDFDVFVINNPLEPKANVRRYKGRTISKPSIDIKSTVLVNTIPSKKEFKYRLAHYKRVFGGNGKILPDISHILSNGTIMSEIAAIDLAKIKTQKWEAAVNSYINELNMLKGNGRMLHSFVDNSVANIISTGPFPEISSILINRGAIPQNNSIIFLSVWQIWQLYLDLGIDFKKACKYVKYIEDKKNYTLEIEDINPIKDRIKISPKEINGKLVVEWPKAHEMSNGQRDIMFFYSKLLEFGNRKKTKPQILIIDEIFDYLDDVNVLLFQYKISSLIDLCRKSKRIIFPILVTHLDPKFFHHFCFNEERINVCYLEKHNTRESSEILRIINNRDNPLIKDKLDAAYFHFHPSYIAYDLKSEFNSLGLNVDWCTPIRLRKKVFRLLRTYLFSDQAYDPISVCWAVRLMIEQIIYSKIANPIHQEGFIMTKKTKEKLKYASRIGIFIPETYFLLGLIYNVSLHNANDNTIESAAIKLNSLVVKDMIKQIVAEHIQLFGREQIIHIINNMR